jgi:hypothetical protein
LRQACQEFATSEAYEGVRPGFGFKRLYPRKGAPHAHWAGFRKDPQNRYGRGDEQKTSITRRAHYYQHKILYRILVSVLWVLEMAVKTNNKHKNVCELLPYVVLSAGNGRRIIYNAQAVVGRSVPSERRA